MFGIITGEKQLKKSLSGKDLNLDSTREILFLRDLGEGETFKGNPIVSIFKNDEKTYNNASIRIINQDENEELRLSVNFAKQHCPFVKNLNNDFGFYLNAFNLVKDVAMLTGVEGVDNNTELFKEVNFKEILEYVDGLDEMEIMGYTPEDSQYMSFRVIHAL